MRLFELGAQLGQGGAPPFFLKAPHAGTSGLILVVFGHARITDELRGRGGSFCQDGFHQALFPVPADRNVLNAGGQFRYLAL